MIFKAVKGLGLVYLAKLLEQYRSSQLVTDSSEDHS